GQLAYTVCMSAACLFIPATLIGALFPALGTMAVASKASVATAVGRVYALNTIGCVIGSLAAGLLLIPALGWFSSFLWILVISLLTGLLALSYGGAWKSPKALVWSVPPLVAAIAFASIVHYTPPLNPACKLLFYGEDSFGAVEIVDDPKLMEGKTLVFNGSCLATTVPNSLRYMRLLGHLPVLLHPKPEKALVGCFGTGSTSGAIAIHPEVKHLDIVELSSMILKQSKLFAAENHDVLSKQKVKAQVNDVRNYLLCTKEKYDVVTFEPPPPSDAGIVNLYTSEFYQLVQKRLNPGGIMCQWAPVACGSAKLWKMMVMTARSVYPYVSIWFPNSHEAIIVASDEPIKIDFDQIQSRIDESPAVAESLRGVGMGDANALIATFAVADKELDDFLGELPAITDDHPSLEFFLPYAGAWLTDLEIEAPGKMQIAGLARHGAKFKSFDKKKFEDNWVAIHLLRMAQYNATDGAKCVDDALKMMPDNPWFQWVHRHKNMAVKGLI
ncbi:MAG: fused MFS/spermidine synthase, partial [Candidatus Obscuribacterales bacterium]|nr:fused MFS/spermidine synthase [Candidatus Obscuribacterales bacterium]